jgi:four helix bundle protein
MDKKFLQLRDVEAYVVAFKLSNFVWRIVIKWDFFSKDTVGKQFVRAVDSVSANIAEGFGRFNKKDKIKFFRYSFSSTKESLDWNEKSKIRNLISSNDYDHIYEELNRLPKLINCLIKYTNEKLKE